MFESSLNLLTNLAGLAILQIICQCLYIGFASCSIKGHLHSFENKPVGYRERYKSLVASITVNVASIIIIYLASLIFGVTSVHIPVVIYILGAIAASIGNICVIVYLLLW